MHADLNHLIINFVFQGSENISTRTILRCRTLLGWTFRGSAYCQLIRTVNKQKRLQWATDNLAESQKENCFNDVIWTDEVVLLQNHHCHSCRRVGEPPKLKSIMGVHILLLPVMCFTFRAKPPIKVHVWAGISLHGATSIEGN